MLTDNQHDVYKKIFEITEQNLKDSGSDTYLSKDAFLIVVGKNPRETDVSRLVTLPPKDYLQALFQSALRRMPDEQLLDSISEERFASPGFKQAMLQSIQHSPEFKDKQGIIINNVFATYDGLPTVEAYFSGYPRLNKIYMAYRKLPQGFRKNIRRMFGRKE